MIFILIASCFMVIYWGGCALDETVTPLLFSLTDGMFPPPNAFGEPARLFTACLTYSEGVFSGLQISVFFVGIDCVTICAMQKRLFLTLQINSLLRCGVYTRFYCIPHGKHIYYPDKSIHFYTVCRICRTACTSVSKNRQSLI